jgi:hypothetical protein
MKNVELKIPGNRVLVRKPKRKFGIAGQWFPMPALKA